MHPRVAAIAVSVTVAGFLFPLLLISGLNWLQALKATIVVSTPVVAGSLFTTFTLRARRISLSQQISLGTVFGIFFSLAASQLFRGSIFSTWA